MQAKKRKKRKGGSCHQKNQQGKCPGKYILTYNNNAPIFECDACGDKELTWQKFYNEYLHLYRVKENWDNKKDQISCIIGFFCHMYKEFYGTAYIFVPKNPNPYGSKECRDAWSLLAAFNGSANSVRKYLYWLFKRGGLSKSAAITSFGYINTPAIIRKYNLYYKKKNIRTRASKLPDKFTEWCKEYAVQIIDNYELTTMNDLGALLSYARKFDESGVEGTVLGQAKSLGLIKNNKLNIGE